MNIGRSELENFQICRSPRFSASLTLLPPHKQVALLENPPIGRAMSLVTTSLAENSQQVKVLPYCIIKGSP